MGFSAQAAQSLSRQQEGRHRNVRIGGMAMRLQLENLGNGNRFGESPRISESFRRRIVFTCITSITQTAMPPFGSEGGQLQREKQGWGGKQAHVLQQGKVTPALEGE
ncbi:hypothetical protein FOPE_12600 [Fonsecaea pedrosoi]|nr:hypothetical protein FOPE_12600 [Fonsecaea pedrosoi]